MTATPAPRLLGLDALRGVAVIFMMEQHLGVWLWDAAPGVSPLAQAPLLMALNGLGGLAAPTFITLAGVGTSLFVRARPRGADLTLVRRGLGLLAFGYALNLLTPSWFSGGSWFVLHLMGLAIATSPLWRRLPSAALLLGHVLLLVVCAPVVQHLLGTPELLVNDRMRRLDLPGGPLRLALAEGQFPVVPWLGLYLSGLVVGRWLAEDRRRPILLLAVAFVAAGLLLAALGAVAAHTPSLAFLLKSPWWRALQLRLSFYPGNPSILFLLQAGSLLLLLGALLLERRGLLTARGALVALGRTSLTLLLLHVVAFREWTRPLGAWQAFSPQATLLIVAAWLLVSATLARAWGRIDYRYGAEWVLRRLGG